MRPALVEGVEQLQYRLYCETDHEYHREVIGAQLPVCFQFIIIVQGLHNFDDAHVVEPGA